MRVVSRAAVCHGRERPPQRGNGGQGESGRRGDSAAEGGTGAGVGSVIF